MTRNKRVYMSDGWHTIDDLSVWMDEVDTILIERTGHGVGYYPDAYYDDWYRLGISPFWAACLALDIAWGIYSVNPKTLRRELGIA